MEDDLVFKIDMGFGHRLSVWVHGGPEDYRVAFMDPDKLEANISIEKCDWERIVKRVEEQF